MTCKASQPEFRTAGRCGGGDRGWRYRGPTSTKLAASPTVSSSGPAVQDKPVTENSAGESPLPYLFVWGALRGGSGLPESPPELYWAPPPAWSGTLQVFTKGGGSIKRKVRGSLGEPGSE